MHNIIYALWYYFLNKTGTTGIKKPIQLDTGIFFNKESGFWCVIRCVCWFVVFSSYVIELRIITSWTEFQRCSGKFYVFLSCCISVLYWNCSYSPKQTRGNEHQTNVLSTKPSHHKMCCMILTLSDCENLVV